MNQLLPEPVTQVRRTDDPGAATPAARSTVRGRLGLRVLGLGLLPVLGRGGALAGGAGPPRGGGRQADKRAASQPAAPPLVAVAVVRSGPADTERVLPGNCLPLEDTA